MKKQFNDLLSNASKIILSKEDEFLMALTCFFAEGHLLIEDIPGVGKTTFAKLLAKILNLSFSRIQFTNDLMPSDIIGFSYFEQKSGEFLFKQGPLFSSFILADELNRGPSKTQSALLEAMEEYQITIDKKTYPLEKPFFVLATQNPREQVGTNPLPESQLDRFMMKMKLGYPSRELEKKLIYKDNRDELINSLQSYFTSAEIKNHFAEIDRITVSESILNYVTEILSLSRTNKKYNSLSPRAGIDIIKSAKAYAYIHDKKMILPDDIQILLPFVIGHRLSPRRNISIEEEGFLVKELIKEIPVL